jgi:hypothetical protein
MIHRRILTATGLALLVSLMSVRTASAQQLLPNLVGVPASEYSIVTDATNGHPTLRFATISWNNGTGPLELFPGAADANGQHVYQRIYNADGSYNEREAGVFVYHPQHSHFHLGNYASYVLRPVGSSSASTLTGTKTSFCILDTTKFNTSLPGASQTAYYTTCGTTMQGMSVGWGDRYGPTLEGQSFDLVNTVSGDYDLMIEIDPANELLEINESDNTSCVRLHVDIAARTVQSLGGCSDVVIQSLTPSTVRPNSVAIATIKGSGFQSGLAVGFENGSGPAPVARNVTWVDANTIQLQIVTGKGGGKQPRTWDLRVGSAVMPRALTITP